MLANKINEEHASGLVKDNTKLVSTPCRLVSLKTEINDTVKTVSNNLRADGFSHEVVTMDTCLKETEFYSDSSLYEAVKMIEAVMIRLDHRLYKGYIYRKVKKGNGLYYNHCQK